MKNNEKKNNKLNLKKKKKQNKTFLLSRVLKNKTEQRREITSTRLDKISRENKTSNFSQRLFIEVQQIRRNCNENISRQNLFYLFIYHKISLRFKWVFRGLKNVLHFNLRSVWKVILFYVLIRISLICFDSPELLNYLRAFKLLKCSKALWYRNSKP